MKLRERFFLFLSDANADTVSPWDLLSVIKEKLQPRAEKLPTIFATFGIAAHATLEECHAQPCPETYP